MHLRHAINCCDRVNGWEFLTAGGQGLAGLEASSNARFRRLDPLEAADQTSGCPRQSQAHY